MPAYQPLDPHPPAFLLPVNPPGQIGDMFEEAQATSRHVQFSSRRPPGEILGALEAAAGGMGGTSQRHGDKRWGGAGALACCPPGQPAPASAAAGERSGPPLARDGRVGWHACGHHLQLCRTQVCTSLAYAAGPLSLCPWAAAAA